MMPALACQHLGRVILTTQFTGRAPGTPQKKSRFQKFHFILELALKKVGKLGKLGKPASEASLQISNVGKLSSNVGKLKPMWEKCGKNWCSFPQIWIALIGRAWCLVVDTVLLKAALPACEVIQGKGTNL